MNNTFSEKRITPPPDTIKEKLKTQINKLHVLVHPGWIFEDNPFAHVYPPSIELKQKYIKYAGTLSPQELMIIFAPAIDAKFISGIRSKDRNMPQPAFAEIIHDIKKCLGERLIVLADSDLDNDRNRGATFPKNKDKIWKKINAIAKKRGFFFSSNMSEEAYGELWHACVKLIAKHIHEAANISQNNPATLKLDLSDYPFMPGRQKQDVENARANNPNQPLYVDPRIRLDFTPFT